MLKKRCRLGQLGWIGDVKGDVTEKVVLVFGEVLGVTVLIRSWSHWRTRIYRPMMALFKHGDAMARRRAFLNSTGTLRGDGSPSHTFRARKRKLRLNRRGRQSGSASH
jgi:hypothetical protein